MVYISISSSDSWYKNRQQREQDTERQSAKCQVKLLKFTRVHWCMQGIFQNMTHLSKTINAIYRTTILYWKNFYNCKEFNALIKQFLLISVKTKDTVKT